MSDVTVVDGGGELHLDAEHLAIGAFDDEVHLVVTVAGAQMADAGLYGLRGDADPERGERLEQRPVGDRPGVRRIDSSEGGEMPNRNASIC